MPDGTPIQARVQASAIQEHEGFAWGVDMTTHGASAYALTFKRGGLRSVAGSNSWASASR
jgi:hypothetical protein